MLQARGANAPPRTLLFSALLVLLASHRLEAQTQPSGGPFEQRFFFEQRAPQERTAPSPRPAEQRSPAGILKNLVVPPAEAEPAPPSTTIPAAGAAAPSQPAATSKRTVSTKQQPAATKRQPASARKQAVSTRKQTASKKNVPSAGRTAAGRPIGRGPAAWYEHSGRTASGELYKPDGRTAAHRSLPFGTRVKVVNLRNQRSVIVRINDRVPRRFTRAIDLSRGSARALGISGLAPVALYKLN
jgi:rare lipoprotein A